MAKKRAAKRTKTPSDNVAIQIRLDRETHEQLTAVASDAEISLNQLVTGILRGAIANVIQGEAAVVGEHNAVVVRERKKCLTFGREAIDTVDERDRVMADARGEPEPPYKDPGQLWFGLDYSGRGLVSYGR